MSSIKPKIAFLGNNITPGGGSASLYLLVKSLNSNKFEKYVYASTCRSEEMKNNFLKHCKKVTLVDLKEICSCQTFDTSANEFEKIKITSDALAGKFLALLVEEKIDILHLNNSVFAHVTEYVKKNSSIKIISHIRELIDHSGIKPLQKYIIERIGNFSDKIIAISDNEAKLFNANKPVTVLANPFDFSGIKNIVAHYRKDHNIADDLVLVAMLGRYNYHKGHLEFLKALKHIIDNKPLKQEFHFVIVGVSNNIWWKTMAKKMLGREDYTQTVKKYINENKLGKHLTLIPYTHNILELVKDMDVIVRPSLNGDPWGRDIIESMALSKPVVATGTSDFYIKNDLTGFLVPVKQPQQLANRIAELIEQKDKRAEFGKNGYAIIKNMCDLENYGIKMENIYMDLLKN